eukprot:TRINITY_DN625_c0_g1_i3.p1 TRINITY_DN625_c0_g1~~TRINITY_DN625_c0_g1_i3.p1  ORF type:complete len:264 (+),score=49.76 TRINITY_DN625_c0_g1_i3:380-1171(+)
MSFHQLSSCEVMSRPNKIQAVTSTQLSTISTPRYPNENIPTTESYDLKGTYENTVVVASLEETEPGPVILHTTEIYGDHGTPRDLNTYTWKYLSHSAGSKQSEFMIDLSSKQHHTQDVCLQQTDTQYSFLNKNEPKPRKTIPSKDSKNSPLTGTSPITGLKVSRFSAFTPVKPRSPSSSLVEVYSPKPDCDSVTRSRTPSPTPSRSSSPNFAPNSPSTDSESVENTTQKISLSQLIDTAREQSSYYEMPWTQWNNRLTSVQSS